MIQLYFGESYYQQKYMKRLSFQNLEKRGNELRCEIDRKEEK